MSSSSRRATEDEARRRIGNLNEVSINIDDIRLVAEITRYLGPESYSRPSIYNGIIGYLIKAIRPLTPAKLSKTYTQQMSTSALDTRGHTVQYRPNPAGETTDAPTGVYGLFGFDPGAGGHESTHQLNQVVTDPVSDAVIDRNLTTSNVSSGPGHQVIDIESHVAGITSGNYRVVKATKPSPAEIWEWYWRNGLGALTLVASISTALVLIFAMERDLGTAFTVASWVLVAGTMFAVTIKGWLWERPEGNEDIPLANLNANRTHPP